MLAFDLRLSREELKRERARFMRSKATKDWYCAQLRKVSRVVGEFIESFPPGDPAVDPFIDDMMQRYAALIAPWAKAVSGRMIAEVNQRDERAWQQHARKMGLALRDEIASAPTGQTQRQLLDEQVALIQSIPLEAAERVHKLTIEGLLDSTRAREIADEIMRSSEVSRSKAMLIGRTEVARTASTLMQARAEYVGSETYVWETSRDAQVRPEHRRLQGKVIEWANPPIAGPKGQRYHAGQGPNCRCWPRPLLPS